MLVLSRKKGESVIITGLIKGQPVEITVTVNEIRGDKVRLGIEAPKEVPVNRQEVYEAIQARLTQGGSDALEQTEQTERHETDQPSVSSPQEDQEG